MYAYIYMILKRQCEPSLEGHLLAEGGIECCLQQAKLTMLTKALDCLVQFDLIDLDWQ